LSERETRETYVVADIGGTSLRIGRMAPGGSHAADVVRAATEGIGLYPQENALTLQRRVMDQLAERIGAYAAAINGPPPSAVGLSFAGPITQDGTALAAPTIWGAAGGEAPGLRVGEELARRLGIEVVAANDITAAAWRYAETESEPFSLYTVSSGVGNKVFYNGRVLLGPGANGGELGHWQVDRSPQAPPCDCGGRGHLGAISSGRGMLAAARRAAVADPSRFRASSLGATVDGQPERITNEELAKAVRIDDAFATGVVREALRPLASAVSMLLTAIGVRRHLFIGGFALAVGARFTELLGDELVEIGCFGLSEERIRAMLRLGFDDDDHSLIGMGRLLDQRDDATGHGEEIDAYLDRR
jgi:C7-cyclitol 7-kinase